MMLRLLTLALAITLVSAPAFAKPGDEDAEQAEYVRLSAEMKTLASKNAWEGVERTFQRLVQTKVPLQYDDYFLAAQAARAAGDVASARDRLVKANDIKEDREVMDWLWEIDSSYGKVSLQCDPGALELQPESMPFHPDRAAAVRFAQKQVADTGTFDGYLPEGNYTFGKYKVSVAPRVQTVRIDARGLEVAKKGRKGREEPETVAEAAAKSKEGTTTEPEPTEEPEVVEEPMPETVATAEPEPAATTEPETVATAEPEPTTEPEPAAEPEPEVAMAEPEPQPFTPPEGGEKTEKVKTPKPAAQGKSPYQLGGTLGVGNNYGGIAGGGLQLVFRPGSGIFAISGGIGYDFQYTSLGLSAAVRVYPQKNIYLGAGVAPLIWYASEIKDKVGVAHGPEVLAGVDFKFGPILIDANIGAGVASPLKLGKLRPAIAGGAGIGTKFF